MRNNTTIDPKGWYANLSRVKPWVELKDGEMVTGVAITNKNEEQQPWNE